MGRSPAVFRLIAIPALCWCCLLEGQETVDSAEKGRDLRLLDSLVLEEWGSEGWSLERLEARDALVRLAGDSEPTPALDWGLALHRWLRSDQDAHLRVRFMDRASGRCENRAPSREDLLSAAGFWAGFAPGEGVPENARAQWLEATWGWVGTYGDCTEGSGMTTEAHPIETDAGMAVEDCGGYIHWTISGFGVESDRSFRKACSRMVRFIRRLDKPVLLDLRGNLGGYRTRRHAVLAAFLTEDQWPRESERPWGTGDSTWIEVPPMPSVRFRRPLDVPLAVLVDGLSFSASLLLADALLHSERAALFGCAPLGVPGGCSGSPEVHVLPGSGWRVEVPTRMTLISLGALDAGYGLSEHATCDAGGRPLEDAISWLRSVRPAP